MGQMSYHDTDGLEVGFLVMSAILYIMLLYFLYFEARQIAYTGVKEYFTDFWNYFDISPVLLVTVVVSTKLSVYYQYDIDYSYNNFLYTIHSLASLTMWLKLLFFLRLFESTGHFIRTLIGVFYDMRVFLFILFIFYMGFGEAFLRISEGNDLDNRFLRNFI